MPNPRRMFVAKLKVHQDVLRDVAVEQKDDADHPVLYSDERFKVFQNTSDGAVIAGSTYMPMPQQSGPSTVYDAALIEYILDDDGVVIGHMQAVSDGYSHSGDEVGRASESACALFYNALSKKSQAEWSLMFTEEAAKQFLIDTGKKHKEAGLTERASLSGCYSRYDAGSSKLQSCVVNVGDSMTVIVGADGQIKQAIAAEEPKSSFGGGPVGINDLDNERDHPHASAHVVVDLAPGDLIIQMTDGIWEQLAIKNQTQTRKITYEAMENGEWSSKTYDSTITTNTLTQAALNGIDLSQQPHGIAAALAKRAAVGAANSGRGDDATISVFRVPAFDPQVEILRALLSDDGTDRDKTVRLFTRLAAASKGQVRVAGEQPAIAKMRTECCLAGAEDGGLRPSQVAGAEQAVFSEGDLERAGCFLSLAQAAPGHSQHAADFHRWLSALKNEGDVRFFATQTEQLLDVIFFANLGPQVEVLGGKPSPQKKLAAINAYLDACKAHGVSQGYLCTGAVMVVAAALIVGGRGLVQVAMNHEAILAGLHHYIFSKAAEMALGYAIPVAGVMAIGAYYSFFKPANTDSLSALASDLKKNVKENVGAEGAPAPAPAAAADPA